MLSEHPSGAMLNGSVADSQSMKQPSGAMPDGTPVRRDADRGFERETMNRRKMILSPSYVDGGADNNGGGGNGAGSNNHGAQLPPGVAAGSAAATAFPSTNSAEGVSFEGDKPPARWVPVENLSEERHARKALEAQVAELKKSSDTQLEAFKAALGLKPEQTAADVQKQLADQQREHQSAMAKLTVHQLATAAGADPGRLLDSNSFLNSIKDLQPGDTAGISAAIVKALEGNTNLKSGPAAGAGSRDAAQGSNSGGNKPSMSELLRAAAGHGH